MGIIEEIVHPIENAPKRKTDKKDWADSKTAPGWLPPFQRRKCGAAAMVWCFEKNPLDSHKIAHSKKMCKYWTPEVFRISGLWLQASGPREEGFNQELCFFNLILCFFLGIPFPRRCWQLTEGGTHLFTECGVDLSNSRSCFCVTLC